MARERVEARLPGDGLVGRTLLQHINRLFSAPNGHTIVSGVKWQVRSSLLV